MNKETDGRLLHTLPEMIYLPDGSVFIRFDPDDPDAVVISPYYDPTEIEPYNYDSDDH